MLAYRDSRVGLVGLIILVLYITLNLLYPPLIYPPGLRSPGVPGDIPLTPWTRDCNCGFRNCRCTGRTIDLPTVIPPIQATLVGPPVVTNVAPQQTAVTVPTVVPATSLPAVATPTLPSGLSTVTPGPLNTPVVPTTVPQFTPTIEIPPTTPNPGP